MKAGEKAERRCPICLFLCAVCVVLVVAAVVMAANAPNGYTAFAAICGAGAVYNWHASTSHDFYA